jgi:hypothetical protein
LRPDADHSCTPSRSRDGPRRHFRGPTATDYDTPRRTDDDQDEDGIEELKAHRTKTAVRLVDLDEGDHGPIELPSTDLSSEELVVRVLPRQADEFTCTNCFLVQHRSRLVRHTRRESICQD